MNLRPLEYDNWLAENFKTLITSIRCTPTQSFETGHRVPNFDSCQLIITCMSFIKLNRNTLEFEQCLFITVNVETFITMTVSKSCCFNKIARRWKGTKCGANSPNVDTIWSARVSFSRKRSVSFVEQKEKAYNPETNNLLIARYWWKWITCSVFIMFA